MRAPLRLCDTVEELGYAVVENAIPASRVDSLCEYVTSGAIKQTRAGTRHLMRDVTIANLAHDTQVMKLAIEILGDEAFPFRVTLFDKSPEKNWLVVWHQDTALPLRERLEASGWVSWSVKEGIIYAHAPASALEQVIALRVALDDSTTDNGPLRVLPGTHCRGLLSDDQLQQCAASIQPVNYVVGRGGIVAMRPLIVHASSKAISSLPRRVLHIEYAAQSLKQSGIRLATA